MNRPVRGLWISAGIALLLISGCAAPSKKVARPASPVSSMPSAAAQAQLHQPFYIPASNLYPSNVIPEPSAAPVYHTVRPKETMWRISQTYHVPINAILEANRIRDARKIKIGQRLLIPGLTAPSSSYAPSRPYTGAMPYMPANDRWRYIVVHHTATKDGNADTINSLHLRRGWKEGMGYHFLIDNGTAGRADGEIETGRRWERQMDGAHANKANMNHIGIGISMVGNFSETVPSEAQLASLVQLVKTLQMRYGIPLSNVIGHRHVPGASTECPGNNFPWNRFRQMLEAS